MTDSNGLYYMRARYYNPDIKRFINQDIKVGDISNGQGLNRYAYCEGNPVSMVDPFGLCGENANEQGDASKYQWLHNALDIAGLAFDVADVINAGVYALEGKWGQAAVSLACALPAVGTAIAGVSKATKFAKAGNIIGQAMKYAGKGFMTVQTASESLKLAGDAKAEYAVNGGKLTWSVAKKAVGALALGALATMSASSLMKDVTSLTKMSDVKTKTTVADVADSVSGKVEKNPGISGENISAGSGGMMKNRNRGSVVWPFGKGGSKTLLPGEGDIGIYKDLIKAGKRGDNITPHHMPSAEYMSKKGIARNDGLCMNMEMPVPGSGGRHRLTDTYGGNMTEAEKAFYYSLSPRDALAYDIKNLRKIYQNDGLYDEIRPQLIQYIKTAKTINPELFEK